MADGEIRRLEPEERDRVGAAEWAICVATFYGDLAERLTNGAFEGFTEMGASSSSIQTFEVPGAFELPLAAKLCAELGPLRRCRLPRRRHPRRDRPLRLRLRRVGKRTPPGHARDRHPLLVRRDHLRHPRAGRGASRRRQARPGPQRRNRRGADAPDGGGRAAGLTPGPRGRYHAASDGQGMSQLRQEARGRKLAQPLDGRDPPPLQPEPPEGADRRGLRPPPRLRLHPLPEGQQGHQGGLRAP